MPSDPAAIRPVTLVDSCVLLDVITGDEQWADWSAEQIAAALDAGRVVINPLIYAEVSVGYETLEELDELLPASDYDREPLPYLAGFAAGKAFVRYRRGGGDKRSPMPDFYIGAHAAVAGYRLLTRDVRRYRTYFPTIEIIAPALAEDETAGQIPAAQLALPRKCEGDELEPGQDASQVGTPLARILLTSEGVWVRHLLLLGRRNSAETADWLAEIRAEVRTRRRDEGGQRRSGGGSVWRSC